MVYHQYFPSVQQPLCFYRAMECYYNITLVDRFYSYPLLNRGCHIFHVDNLITPSVSEATHTPHPCPTGKHGGESAESAFRQKTKH